MEFRLDPNDPSEKTKLQRLFRVKRTEIEMMQDRGYSIKTVWLMNLDTVTWTGPIDMSPLLDINFIFDDFLLFRERYNIFLTRQTFSSIYIKSSMIQGTQPQVFTQIPQNTLMIIYLLNNPGKQVDIKNLEILKKQLSISTRKEMSEFFGQDKLRPDRFILITETGLNPSSKTFVKREVAGKSIETFLDIELSFNRTKHALAPIKIDYIEQKLGATDNDPSTVNIWGQEEGVEPEQLPMIFNSDPMAKWYGAKPTDVLSTIVLGSNTDIAGYYRIVRQPPAAKK